MALVQRLNELAAANSEGLLNDDEYRLLRQDVFEQYSGNANIPVEIPLVPITALHGSTPKGYRIPTSKPQQKPALDQRKSPPSRTKPSAASGMVNLIRKATGRKPSTVVHETPPAKDTRRGVNMNVLVNDVSKRIVPRLLHKKLVELPPLVMDTSKTHPKPPHPVYFSNTLSENTLALPPLSPLSPTGSARRIVPSSSSIRETKTPDVFDNDNLTTADDIRAAITTCEDEARNLVDAFNDLEASALRRFHKQNARRMPVTTPNVNVLLEGREWREHRLIPSPSSPVFDFKERHMLNSADSTGDGMSIRSASSHKTSLSQAKSISSLRKYPPSSPLSPHFRIPSITPVRRSSISSISSQTTSFTSTRMLAATPSFASSQSTSHLALPKLKGNTESISTEAIGLEDGDDESEVSNIRRRREELVVRYTARLEFLRAKLKGAELHEKLLRK